MSHRATYVYTHSRDTVIQKRVDGYLRKIGLARIRQQIREHVAQRCVYCGLVFRSAAGYENHFRIRHLKDLIEQAERDCGAVIVLTVRS